MNVDPSGLVYRIAITYGRTKYSSRFKEPSTLCEFISALIRGIAYILLIIFLSCILGLVLIEPIAAIAMHNIFGGSYVFFGNDSAEINALFIIGCVIWFLLIVIACFGLAAYVSERVWFQSVLAKLHTIKVKPTITSTMPNQLNDLVQNVKDIYSAITGKLCVHMNYYENDAKRGSKNENSAK